MAFRPDYPDAVVWPAHPSNYGYGRPNQPKGFVLHTPEEPADPHGGTPLYFAQPNRQASTHYFVTYAGGVYQMVPESEGAYANAVQGKPYPGWADATVNLNLQTLSVEIEGYASNIHETMPVGSPQWKALVALVKDRCTARRIPVDRTHVIGHYEVSSQRSDPGAQFPWESLIVDLRRPSRDDLFLQFARLRSNIIKLALEDDYQAIVDALTHIGIRPSV